MVTKQIRKEPTEGAAERAACPECQATSLARDEQRGELVCSRCGLVVEERAIDPGPEWRAFDSAQREKRARTGAPANLMLHDKGLSTDIGWSDKDGQGRRISGRNRMLMFRLRRWHRRMRVHGSERNLALALGELDRTGSRMGLPRNVRETASMIHRRAVQKGVLRGRSVEAVAAASLYAACRQCGVPRTLEEVAAESRVARKVLGRTYRHMARELKLRIAPTSPLDYLPRFASALELSPDTQAYAAKLVRDAGAKGLTNGKSPLGVAGAALYIASLLRGEPRTQKSISEAAGVTEVTIRNHYQELARELDLRVPTPGALAPPTLPRTTRTAEA